MDANEVLITGEHSKLPPEVAGMLDPNLPLPIGVIFFEKRFEIDELIKRIFIAIGCALASVIVIPFGVASLFSNPTVGRSSDTDYLPLIFGVVLLLAAWMLLASVRTSWKLRKLQLSGMPTRRRIFLTPTSLVPAEASDTTIIPPSQFRGADGGKVKYQHNGTEKSAALPSHLMNGTADELQQAIHVWAKGFERT